MASVKQQFTAKYQTTKDGDMEEATFSVGDSVTIVHTWAEHFLIKDRDGHYYNIKKELITP